MSAYYNEIDPYAAQWLRNLISARLIAPGDVDERSIKDVQPDDLKGYTQCHFFAGISGWSVALRMAGWDDDRPVWTGSCPCQPWSSAGKQSRQSDERHLWPYWARLIRECRPSTIFGEQVDEAIAAGWIDDVFHEMEEEAYACAATVLHIGPLHVSDRSRNATDSTGWPTPSARDYRDLSNNGKAYAASRERHQPSAVTISIQLRGYGNAGWIHMTVLPPDEFPRPVGIIRAFGNAIDPELAAEFIAAYMEATESLSGSQQSASVLRES